MGGGRLKEARWLRVSQCQKRVPTKSIMCVDSPWTKLPLATAAHFGNGRPQDALVGDEKKGVLCHLRHGQSDLLATRGAALARDPQLSKEY